MLYAHAISGSADAARFLSPDEPSAAPKIAADILETKLKTYLKFNETYPGFGGILPWYANTEGSDSIEPTWDWVNRVPALDNGYVSPLPLFFVIVILGRKLEWSMRATANEKIVN